MKSKLLIVLLGVLMLTGCMTSTSDEVREDKLYHVREQVKCVNGKKIWIMQNLDKGGVTSQIVGDCE